MLGVDVRFTKHSIRCRWVFVFRFWPVQRLATGWPRCRSSALVWARCFSFPCCQERFRTHQASYPIGTGNSLPGDKAQRCEAGHSPPSPGPRIRGFINPLHHIPSWSIAELVKHWDHLYFFTLCLSGTGRNMKVLSLPRLETQPSLQ
jgi:hypothetical protein